MSSVAFRTMGNINKSVIPEMVWVDLETTGLDDNVRDESVLEVGIIVTDKFGAERASFCSLVFDDKTMGRLGKANDVVKNMHFKSGLLDDIQSLADRTADVVEELPVQPYRVAWDAYKWLQETCEGSEVGVLPMCGSTIGFDRVFLKEHMAVLNSWFHYRNVDVTTIKNLCRMHRPDLYKLAEQTPQDQKWHRPLQDLRGSIAEYRFYLNNFLHA